ncbi:hypothetical protein PE066_13920 [Ramlibacter tataouinensis]|uniref:hypothetical protein n=1 Tax=Ramlibacter tataouinensis TaxID=94132 RepID=UPI0022F3C7DF|nr:hypothetical protein [Ramlibacter tataouinensis]WBY00560.1 hypothetical protein PE066_13920 [Ramlibacter tataouinensis]
MSKSLALLFLAVTAACSVVLQRLAPEWQLLESLAVGGAIGVVAVLLASVQARLQGRKR